MDVYIFQAALLCTDCAEEVIAASKAPTDDREDSDRFPQGPYANGGGEADSPQHCDHCRVFLDNSLTPDGSAYVKGLWEAFVQEGRGNIDILIEWREAYPNEFAEFGENLEPNEEHLTDLAQRRLDALTAR